MSKSKILLYLCASFIGGIFLNSFFRISQVYLILFLISGIFFISIAIPEQSEGQVKMRAKLPSPFWNRRNLAVFGFCLLFIAAGIWRHQEAQAEIADSILLKFNDSKKAITLFGVLAKEPAAKEKNQKLTLQPENIKEKILITANSYPEYNYGDKLKITGFLKSPSADIDGFNYQDYLKKDGIVSVMNFPKIELVERGSGPFWARAPFYFKNRLKSAAEKFFSPPQLGILEALVFGDESELSNDWKNKLNFTGTRHIAAVSGMNITIIGLLILSFFLGLGFWRQQAFYISLFLISFYIIMVGAPASALRAGIMAGILMTGQYFGRLSYATRAVVFAAFLMLLANPFLLKSDVGFQLSFLAILGLIFLQPILGEWLKNLALSATLSAQIFAAPILLYNFGYISLLSPLPNVLIVPVLAPLTVLIFIFGFAAIIALPFGFIFYLPLWFSLSYVVKIIDWFSQFSFAALTVENLHWIWLAISYFILAFLIRHLQEKRKLKFLQY